MTTSRYLRDLVLPAAYRLLPVSMESREASACLLAIACQESQYSARRQMGDGPARGFWQAERTGGCVRGIMTHRATKDIYRRVCGTLAVPFLEQEVYDALEHNDVLAAVAARQRTHFGRVPHLVFAGALGACHQLCRCAMGLEFANQAQGVGQEHETVPRAQPVVAHHGTARRVGLQLELAAAVVDDEAFERADQVHADQQRGLSEAPTAAAGPARKIRACRPSECRRGHGA